MTLKGGGFGNPSGDGFDLNEDDWIAFWVYIYEISPTTGTLFTMTYENAALNRYIFRIDNGRLCVDYM